MTEQEIKLLSSRYYTPTYYEEDGKKFISIGHIEPWKHSTRTENVFTFDVTNVDENKIKTIQQAMFSCCQVINEHSKEIMEYYFELK